jgi:hypothetical protein
VKRKQGDTYKSFNCEVSKKYEKTLTWKWGGSIKQRFGLWLFSYRKDLLPLLLGLLSSIYHKSWTPKAQKYIHRIWTLKVKLTYHGCKWRYHNSPFKKKWRAQWVWVSVDT